SMKMMHGAFFFPCSKRSRTRLAPTPTNISTKSEPEIEKNGTFASPAMARARRPHQQHALRDAPAQLLKFLRVAQEVDDFLQLFLGLIGPRHILERSL